MKLYNLNKEQEEKLLEALNGYYKRNEWDSIDELPEDGIIPLGHYLRKLGDNRKHVLEIRFDLNKLSYLNYIDDMLVLVEDIESLDRFIYHLESCKLIHMIWNCIDEGNRMYGGYVYDSDDDEEEE